MSNQTGFLLIKRSPESKISWGKAAAPGTGRAREREDVAEAPWGIRGLSPSAPGPPLLALPPRPASSPPAQEPQLCGDPRPASSGPLRRGHFLSRPQPTLRPSPPGPSSQLAPMAGGSGLPGALPLPPGTPHLPERHRLTPTLLLGSAFGADPGPNRVARRGRPRCPAWGGARATLGARSSGLPGPSPGVGLISGPGPAGGGAGVTRGPGRAGAAALTVWAAAGRARRDAGRPRPRRRRSCRGTAGRSAAPGS